MQNSITIPLPCHENWDNMQAHEKGKFCTACNKPVIDFSNKTKKEIIHEIKNASSKICGRFKTVQLKTQVFESPIKNKARQKFIKYAAASMLMFKLSMPSAMAQGAVMVYDSTKHNCTKKETKQINKNKTPRKNKTKSLKLPITHLMKHKYLTAKTEAELC